MSIRTAILGATGAVGDEFLRILEERNFPVSKLTLLASERSVGKRLKFKGEEHVLEDAAKFSWKGTELGLFSAGASRSREFAPKAAAAGVVVVDNSSAFRMDPKIPLVIPEVNPGDLKNHPGIIANPNCSTIIMAVPVWPLHRANPVRRMVVATYQAASGAGAKAMQELIDQTRDVLAGKTVKPQAFPHRIAFNLFSHNSAVAENGYNEEENKMLYETRKIFHAPDIRISTTCVRVAVLRAHTEAINLEFDRPFPEAEARRILSSAEGVQVVDDRKTNTFPMPIEATGKDPVLVGRIRQDISMPNQTGLALLAAGDQLRKGAALNAVQIAERLFPRA
ncbi:MAG: aspartate-semialdehyde dehydrogenase [Planctomycetota bacterium]